MSSPHLTAIFGHHFCVDFETLTPTNAAKQKVTLCRGAFSEVTGLESSMTPFSIAEGGRNTGQAMRAGPVTNATVILKRGVIDTQSDLYRWYALVTGGAYAFRLNVLITVVGHNSKNLMTWKLVRALPVKFKMADLNARAAEIAIEELHLVHEGLSVVPAAGAP